MYKRLVIIVILCLAVLSGCGISGKNFSLSGAKLMQTSGYGPVSGTFIQPWLYINYSDEQLESELISLRDEGVTYLIMGDTAERKSDGEAFTVYYPSSLDGVIMGPDYVGRLISACKKTGLKLYLGLGSNAQWWNRDLSLQEDAQAFLGDAKFAACLARDLHKTYKEQFPNTFYGFYLVYEIWNHASLNSVTRREAYAQNLSAGFNLIINSINETAPEMPLLFSPFSSDSLFNASLENTGLFYRRLFELASFRSIDIICPMDNVGGGSLNVNTVEKWHRMYRLAVDESGNKLKLFSNVECFVQPKGKYLSSQESNYWESAPVKRFIRQIEIAQLYADEIFSFALPHYYSTLNNNPAFHDLFKAYCVTGATDDSPPAAPLNINLKTAPERGKSSIKISWETEADSDAVKFEVRKKGLLIDYRVSKINSLAGETSLDSFVYFDNFQNGDTFQVTVYDAWGNKSESEKIGLMIFEYPAKPFPLIAVS